MNTPAPKKYKILLIGDACVDTYTYGHVNRISPEAPIPIFEPKYKIVKDGMASNVCKNLEALGCEVTFIHGKVSNKERLIDIRSKQQVVRIDRDEISDTIDKLTMEQLIQTDAVVISDYNKGLVSYNLINFVTTAYRPKPIFIDTKKQDLAKLNDCIVKINALEHKCATSLPDSDRLVVTHGGNGALWNGWIYPAETAGEVIDITGAGDTFLSALAYKFLETRSMPDAITFANKASAITVHHVGVYAPTLKEIE